MDKCPYCGAQLFGNPYTCYKCQKEILKPPSSEPAYFCLGCNLPIDPNTKDINKVTFHRDAVSNIDHSPVLTYNYYYHTACSFKAERVIEYMNNPQKQFSDMMMKSSMEDSKKYGAIESIGVLIFLIVALFFLLKDCFG